jgi:hypothetical protein
LDNVLSLPSTAPTRIALTELGYDSIIDIAAMSQEEILELDYDDSGSRKKVPLKERKMLLHVVLWRNHEASKLASGLPDWMSLEANVFDTFVQVTIPALARKAVKSLSSVGVGGDVTATDVANFQSQIKLDVKAFCVFNGEITDWLPIKRGMVAVAASQGLSRVFQDPAYVPVPGTHDADMYAKQNTFIYNMLATCVMGGMALTLVRQHEVSQDGRKAFDAICEWYESASNMQLIQNHALGVVSNTKFCPNSNGAIVKFLKDFKEALLDLEYTNWPMSNDTNKTFLLVSIEDKDYEPTVDCLQNDPSVTYEECLQQLHQRGMTLQRTAQRPMDAAKPRHGKKASASGEPKKDGDDKDKGGKKDTRKAKKAGKNANADNDKKKGGRGGGSSDS